MLLIGGCNEACLCTVLHPVDFRRGGVSVVFGHRSGGSRSFVHEDACIRSAGYPIRTFHTTGLIKP